MRNPQQAALDPRNSGCRQDCLGDVEVDYGDDYDYGLRQ